MTQPRARRLRVSDHALLRFIERAGGLDIETLRRGLEESLNRAVLQAAAIGEDEFTVDADGLRYIVRNGVVVTIADKSRRAPRRS